MSTFKQSKKCKAIILTVFLGFLLSFSFGKAVAKNQDGDFVVVESGQVLENVSFFSGNNIRIDGDINATTILTGGNVEVNGTIDGDLFVAGQVVTINGTVNGSIFIAPQNITINGIVENSMYLAGSTIRVNSKTSGSVFLAGESIYLEEAAVIGKDIYAGGSTVYLDGIVSGDFFSSSDSVSITGTISGDLNYRSQKEAAISNNSQIAGEINWKKIQPKPAERTMYIPIWVRLVFSVLSSLVVWFFIRSIRPDFWMNMAERIMLDPLKALGTGAVVVLLTPIISLLLLITMIGAPLSMILFSLYSMSLYISKIILSLFIGQWIRTKFNWHHVQLFWLFLLSLITLSVVSIIPIVGWVFSFTIVSFGLGSLYLSVRAT